MKIDMRTDTIVQRREDLTVKICKENIMKFYESCMCSDGRLSYGE